MSRINSPGLARYQMDTDHIHNKKVRLLISEFDSNGYWIWNCLISEGYRTNGYYYDCNDKDELELFALDVCKKQVSLVREVIAGCIRRGLFDKTVFDMFGILSSPRMQDMYIHATKERRKKGTTVKLHEDYLLIPIAQDEVNITILPRTNLINPRTKAKNPGTSTHSKVEYSKEDVLDSNSITGKEVKEDSVLPDANAPAIPKTFKSWSEQEFYDEIAKHQSLFSKEILRNFFDYWKEKNATGKKMRFQLERTWETKNRLETWQRNQEIFSVKNKPNGAYQQTPEKRTPGRGIVFDKA